MEKRDPSQSLRMKYVFISLILVMAMFLAPVAPAIRLHQVTMLWEKMISAPTAQAEGPGNSTIYLPIAITAGEAQPPAAPAFEIISPANGGIISGMMYFAVQPTDAATVSSVTFKAGSTDLGTDSDGSDGFKVFLNASDLPAGTLELSAIGTGVGGETTKRITVNVVPNPPSSATVGSEGGVLASEIGSIITLVPGAVPDGTNISVTEMTQEEVTTENGFDWDAMGVTFLGAQKIQSNANISKPLGVASAGFGNRVQPGQTVVNYRIAPDADGDGVDELIVVNTASVAPNGDVISDPISEPVVNSIQTPLNRSSPSRDNLLGPISGPPGTPIQLEVLGFNPFSAFGNVAVFRSSVDGTEFEYPGVVIPDFDNPSATSDQEFVTVIPYLPAGAATLVLRNESTGFVTEPINIVIEEPPALQAPARQTINNYLDLLPQLVNNFEKELGVSTLAPDLQDQVANRKQNLIQEIANFRQELDKLDETDEGVQEFLNGFATMIENSGLLSSSRGKSLRFATMGLLGNFSIGVGIMTGGAGFAAAASTPATAAAVAALLGVSAAAITTAGVAIGVGLIALGFGIALGTAIRAGINLFTGMGAARPSGGSTGGSVAAGAGGGLRNQRGGGFGLEPGRFVIKVLSGGSSIPFSGVTDAGGYFFIPLIPEAEPFTAIAFDTMTGQTRTFEGTGPPTGQSVLMFFDFINEGAAVGTPIEIGNVINGEISAAGELDIYSFSAQAGQQLFFDVQDQSGISEVNWKLLDRTGSTIFDTCLGCSDPGVQTLTQGGTYTLIVGEGGNKETGTYQLQLWNVPPPNEFTINIGDVISDSHPAAGAGNIESPGVKDIYTFNASAGQQVFFDLQEQNEISLINWQVKDEDGMEIFNTCLGCSDPGVQTLTRGGTYTITVGDDSDDAFGTYQFQLWNVPAADEFTINIGDVISDSNPAAGAGNIESPGVKDIYTFNASAGQQVFFDLQEQNGISLVNWQVKDEDGTVVFDTCLGCSDPGVQTLTRGGTYTIIVGDDGDDTFGTYQFQLWNVPAADEFAINIGDIISNGNPAAGAGNIESPGVKDIYTFNASAGQQVFFDIQEQNGISLVNWQVKDEDGTVVFDTCLGCSDPGLHTLTRGGTYTITVGEDGNDGFGTYSFQMRDKSLVSTENSVVPISR